MKKKTNVKLVILFAIMIFSFMIVYLSTSFIELNLDFTEWERGLRQNVLIIGTYISVLLNVIYIGITCINKME